MPCKVTCVMNVRKYLNYNRPIPKSRPQNEEEEEDSLAKSARDQMPSDSYHYLDSEIEKTATAAGLACSGLDDSHW